MRIGKYKFKINKNTKRWRKPLAIGAIAILLVSMFSLYSSNKSTPSAKAAWYQNDGSWPYRQKFQVTSNAALTDYQTVLDEGEVARWNMDEGSNTTANDVSGNSNNGTITNAAWTANGKYSNGLTFSGGNSEKVTIANSPSINPYAPFTVSIWVKYTTTSNLVILEKNGNSGFSLQCNLGKLSFWVGGDTRGPQTLNAYNDNAWHHVVAVVSGTAVGDGKIYIDGIEDSTGNDPNTPAYGSEAPVYIGSRNGSYIFNGSVDETRIFNRALSQTEISYLYANNISPKLQQIYAQTQESGADLRFTTSDQTTDIPYWIEKYTAAGQNAKIYLQVPSVANGTTDIYAYYGNSGASAASSGTNTFILFDDFESYSTGNLPTNANWLNRTGTWQVSTTYASSGTKALYSSGGGGGDSMSWLNSSYTTDNGVLEAKIYTNPAVSADSRRGLCTRSTVTPSQGHCLLDGGNGNYPHWLHSQVVWGTAGSYSMSASAWHNMTIKFTSTNLYGYADAARTDWARSTATGTYTGLTGGRVASYFDDIRIRKYTATEPTMAMSGAEEIGDLIAPSNPSSITALSALGGDVLSASNVYAHSAPYFDWPAVDAPGGASDTGGVIPSGVAGYYSYFGTSCGGGGANPATTRGLLSEVGGTGVHYSADTEVTSPALTSAGTYCLRMKTKDNFGNVQGTVWEAFVYQFDNVAPNAPSYIAASPSGYTGTNSFSFSWPVATDGTSSPQAGIAGYQYKRGTGSGDSWSGTQVGRSVSGVLKYQDGANVFIVRSVDTAGNTSGEVQTSYYYNANAPAEPGSLAVSPDQLSQTNAFSFTWTEPTHDIAIVDYGYSVNAWPTNTNITWIGSSDLSLASGPYATQQGTNDFYLVAKDEAGNYAFDAANVAQISFECDSVAPPVPTSVAITDSSNRTADIWSLTLKWVAGIGQSQSSFDHYSIYRSTDNATFAEIATTSSTSYVDTTSLVSDTTYYYYIKAVDNADQASAASTTVSRMPTGKYLSPPSFVSTEPTVTTKAGEATIGWVTDRNSSSMVRFGTDQNTLDNSQGQLDSVTDHSVTVKGLKSSTTYYYQVQSLDEMRDYSSDLGYSAKFSFTTTGLPSIANVNVSNITLTSADISWETTAATNHTVNYGTSINYDQSEEGDSGSYVTNHSLKLQNLSHSTTYHFKISGSDQDNNLVSSDDYILETQKMPEISFISYNQGNDGPTPIITVEWKTNVPTTSSIEYFPKDGSVKDGSEQSESAMITEHKMILQGLSDSTEYTFSVFGRDQFGNLAQSSENVLRTNDDKRPPKIDDVVYEVSNVAAGSEDESRVFVYWKTDEPSTSQVEYGEGIKGEQFTQNTKEDGLLTNSHLVIVPGLKNQSPHFMRACSKDKAGNQSCSEASTVVPGEAKKSVFQRLLDAIVKNFAWVGRIVGI